MNVIQILKSIAQYGHAPTDGCSLFGANYDEAFERLKNEYIIKQFDAGASNEKFVIGPFGSGKTHFLRQLMEIGRVEGCATAEVMLNKDIDFTDNMAVYREIAREIRLPNRKGRGIESLLLASLDKVVEETEDESVAAILTDGWIAGLRTADFKEINYGKLVARGLEAYRRGETEVFESICAWLSGDVTNASLAKKLSLSVVKRNEQAGFGRRILLSLCQFIKYSKFRGTVIAFDEAEQGLAVDGRKREKILSMLQSIINAFADLQDGATLQIFGLTPEIAERFDSFAALQQRLADPRPGRGFFDGSTLSPKIDLMLRSEPLSDLQGIGYRLTDMLYEHTDSDINVPKDDVIKKVEQIANEVYLNNPSSGNRRDMAKRTSAMLVGLYEYGVLEENSIDEPEEDEKEV